MCISKIRKIVNDANCIVLDIEGTTTSIDFVKKELFPYAEQHLEEYVKEHWNKDEMHEVTNLLLKEQDLHPDAEKKLLPEQAIAHWRLQMTQDLKTTSLKTLQGQIWKKGYDIGVIQGHVYSDVPTALKVWKDLGKKIFIYSSGSIEAQKLLLCNSVLGDLHGLIDGHFDTTVGSKLEAESYIRLAQTIGQNPENVVFFTDRPKEVVAAKQMGMKVVRVVRELQNPFLEQETEFIGEEDGTIDSFSCLL